MNGNEIEPTSPNTLELENVEENHTVWIYFKLEGGPVELDVRSVTLEFVRSDDGNYSSEVPGFDDIPSVSVSLEGYGFQGWQVSYGEGIVSLAGVGDVTGIFWIRCVLVDSIERKVVLELAVSIVSEIVEADL